MDNEGTGNGKVDKEDVENGNDCDEEWPAQTTVRPKKGSKVKFVMKGDDKVKEGKVVNVRKKTSRMHPKLYLNLSEPYSLSFLD